MPAELRVICDVCHETRPPQALGWQQLLVGTIAEVGMDGEARVDRTRAIYLCCAACSAKWYERQARTARADRPTLPGPEKDR